MFHVKHKELMAYYLKINILLLTAYFATRDAKVSIAY